MREGFALTRDGVIVDANPALSEITGFPREQLIGARQPYPFWPPEMLDDATGQRTRVHARDGGSFQTTYVRADGRRFVAETTAVPVHDADGEPAGFLNTIRDVTERVRADDAMREHSEELAALAKVTRAVAHAELERLVRTDALTGLPNRRVVEDVSQREIASARRTDQPLSFAMLDLDRFKDYNDAHGHPAGDTLLRAVSRNWSRRMRETDLLARWGGEEFCLLLPGCDLDGADELIEQLRGVVPEAQTFSAGLVAWRQT